MPKFENWLKSRDGTYAHGPIGEEEEDGDIGNFNDEPYAIDSDDEKAVGMNNGKTIEHPHSTIQHCCDVWIWFESLHRFRFPDLDECWAANRLHHLHHCVREIKRSSNSFMCAKSERERDYTGERKRKNEMILPAYRNKEKSRHTDVII